MWLDWDLALAIGAVLGAVGLLWRPGARRARQVAAVAREAALVFVLYALWQYAAGISVLQVDGAYERARAIWRIERLLNLPSEAALQHAALARPFAVQAANIYYAGAHVPAVIAFLVWLFLRHRRRYPPVRNVLALVSAACLAIQLVPVAPPRMFPDLGFVDAAARYGQSVYPTLGEPGPSQLGAMPSVHVAWALLVGFVVWRVSASPWRWAAVAHAALTVGVVTVTANHWWLDGIVAALLLAGAVGLERAARAVWERRFGPPGWQTPSREAELVSASRRG
ncbi:MAG: phosphatase PAP2 family protein [Acidimicrobiales bacterium]